MSKVLKILCILTHLFKIGKLLDKYSQQIVKIEGLPGGIMELLVSTFPLVRDLTFHGTLKDLCFTKKKVLNLQKLILTVDGISSHQEEYNDLLIEWLNKSSRLSKFVLACYSNQKFGKVIKQLPSFDKLVILGLIGLDLVDDDIQYVSECKNLKIFSLGITERVTKLGIIIIE